MSRDLLSQVAPISIHIVPEEFKMGSGINPESFENEYQKIFSLIKSLDNIRYEVKGRTQRFKLSTKSSDESKIIQELNILITKNVNSSQKIIEQIKLKRKQWKLGFDNKKDEILDLSSNYNISNVNQWKINKLNLLQMKLYDRNVAFENRVTEFQTEVRDKQKRLIQNLTSSKLSEEELNDVLSNPQKATKYIENEMQMVESIEVNDKVLDKISELEIRDQKMTQIVDSLNELRQLMKDLSFVVDEADEQIENIADNVIVAKIHVEEAAETIVRADVSQKKAIKYQYYFLCLLLIVLAVGIYLITKFV